MASGDLKSRAIVILGMHRSGTSAATRLCNLLGADLGSRLMPPAEGNNETGFWEHQDVVEIHEALLTHLDRSWDDVRALPGDVGQRRDLTVFHDQMLTVLRRDFTGRPLWAIKDPRMCRLLPFWRSLFAAMEAGPAYVFVLRNPLEIAGSLAKRDGFPPSKGLLLWLRHALEAERDSRGGERVFVRYEDLMADWRSTMEAVGQGLGIAWPRTPDDIAAEVAGFLRPSLRHNVVDDAAVTGDERLSRWVREAHRLLSAAAEGETSGLSEGLDAVAREVEAAERLYDPVVADISPRTTELTRRLLELESAVGERDTRIAERDSRIVERDSRIGEQEARMGEWASRVTERDAWIAERDTRIAERDTRIAERDSRIADRDNQIANLHHMAEGLHARIHALEGDLHHHRLSEAHLREQLQNETQARLAIYRSTSWRLTMPVRAAARAGRAILRLARRPREALRYRLHPVALKAGDGVTAEGDRFRLTESTGWITLEAGRGAIRPGMALLSYEMDSDGGPVQAWLHHTGEERLPFRTGKVEMLIALPSAPFALRIERPRRSPSFAIRNLTITELGPVPRAGRAFAGWLRPALSDPKLLMPKLRQLRTLLATAEGRGQLHRWLQRQGSVQDDYQNWIVTYDTLSETDCEAIRKRIAAMAKPPLISIVMPTYNSPEKWLRRAIESVQEQLYPHWEFCIADDCSKQPHVRAVLEEFAAADTRIKLVFREANGHISLASNSALDLATGDYVALLDHDDELPIHALYMVAEEVLAHPDADIVFSDEDKIDEKGTRYEPYFKSAYNPDLFLSHNMISHLGVYRASLLREIGGFRQGLEGSQDYDLALRSIERSSPARIRHIPHILYHWRAIPGSVALSSDQKDYAHDIARKAIQEHLDRTGRTGATVVGTFNDTLHRVDYPLPAPAPRVSIIVPTRDRLDLLERCVTTLLDKTDYPDFELIVVDNRSQEEATRRYFETLRADARVRILDYDKTYNYADLNNVAVATATGSIVCFLNNDIEVIEGSWLAHMVSHALRPEVGAVGAKLLFPDDTVQHAGIVLVPQLTAWHAHKHLHRTSPGYFGRAILLQDFSAVTAACMVMRREVFEETGGFDAEHLGIAYNDVDLCLRLGEKGYRILWTPFATLYHHESASLGQPGAKNRKPQFEREAAYFRRRWQHVLADDPCYSPNLTQDRTDFSTAFPPRVDRPWLSADPASASPSVSEAAE